MNGNDLDLEDARRVIASLNALKLWLDGAGEHPGVLEVLDKVLAELNRASNEILNLRNDNLKEFGDLLTDTVHSAIAAHSEQSSLEFESAIKKSMDGLPGDVAKITIRALAARSSKKPKDSLPLELQAKVAGQAKAMAAMDDVIKRKDEHIASLGRFLIASCCVSGLSILVLIMFLLGA
jgi:ATP-dependent Clp protease ATP-binding subunit ClpA